MVVFLRHRDQRTFHRRNSRARRLVESKLSGLSRGRARIVAISNDDHGKIRGNVHGARSRTGPNNESDGACADFAFAGQRRLRHFAHSQGSWTAGTGYRDTMRHSQWLNLAGFPGCHRTDEQIRGRIADRSANYWPAERRRTRSRGRRATRTGSRVVATAAACRKIQAHCSLVDLWLWNFVPLSTIAPGPSLTPAGHLFSRLGKLDFRLFLAAQSLQHLSSHEMCILVFRCEFNRQLDLMR